MRAPGLIFLVLLAAAARADDASAPPADAIAAAKKDLAEIKAPVSAQDGANLPSLDLKDMGPVPGARPEMVPILDPDKDPSLNPPKKKPGTGNWLVDAMDKNTGSQGSRTKEKDDILKGDPDLIRADEKGVRLEKDALELDDSREKERPKAPAEAVYNPLDSFMGGWISARDHDLLLTPARGDGPPGSEPLKTRNDLLPGLEVGASQPAADFTLPPIDSGWGESKASANPYVAVMELEVASPMKSLITTDAPAAASTDLQDLPRAMTSFGGDPTPLDAPRSFIPDFAQPDDDDKYFKQLKKF